VKISVAGLPAAAPAATTAAAAAVTAATTTASLHTAAATAAGTGASRSTPARTGTGARTELTFTAVALVDMGAIKPRTCDFAEHAGEAGAAPCVLELRARTVLLLAAAAWLLCIRGRRKRNDRTCDPCRQRSEDHFPHGDSPKKHSAPRSIKEGVPFSAS
jgi:hypothetical protein